MSYIIDIIRMMDISFGKKTVDIFRIDAIVREVRNETVDVGFTAQWADEEGK